jgi:hypothetical protein
MDKKLRKILTECIRDIETGARDVDGCLERHPDRAAELRPHLELWSGLDAASMARPNFAGQQRGHQRLLAAITDLQRREADDSIPNTSIGESGGGTGGCSASRGRRRRRLGGTWRP